jgi:glycosyltransferase involved in cell wall biosynthesis
VPSLVLDCRWLGYAGAGRATEHLLRGLGEGPRRARWTLWGPGEAAELAPGLPHLSHDRDPREWAGQRATLSLPRRRSAMVFMHQTRPLLAGRCVTVIHDTTQLRTAGSARVARARRAFLRRVAASSAGVITVSDWSRTRISEDLGLAPERVRVVGNPADRGFGERIRRLRQDSPRREMALYVGSFAPHKNVEGLIEGFLRSTLRGDGGELMLVGGRPEESRHLRARVDDARITIVEQCPQDLLDRLFASARVLVQPSFEEGFGLPVSEALSAGIPVACSRGGALEVVGAGAAARFDPHSADGIASAIDVAVARGRDLTSGDEEAAAALFLAGAPTLAEYADRMEDAVLDLLGEAHGH